MPLHRIIYASTALDVDRNALTDILGACERNNAPACISGMLLFNNGHFLQLLEGDRAAVCERFRVIAADPRHDEVEILLAGPIDARSFVDWSMSYVSSQGTAARILRRYLGGLVFNPYKLSASAVERLCKDFAQEMQSAAAPV